MAKKKKTKKTAGKKLEMMVVSSKVKAFIRSKKMMTSAEFIPALNRFIHMELGLAVTRAKLNRRATLRQQDL